MASDYTIGVWVGRPDGTPLPGYYGAQAAAPLLFSIANHLPAIQRWGDNPSLYRATAPSSVSEQETCWPLGALKSQTAIEHCHQSHTAYLLDGNVPVTFAERDVTWQRNPLTVLVNSETGKRVDERCTATQTRKHSVALWPPELEPWVTTSLRRTRQIPDYDDSCPHPPALATSQPKIIGIHSQSIVRPVGQSHSSPSITLESLGGIGRHYWFINGEMHYQLSASDRQLHRFNAAGRYRISVVDELGSSSDKFVGNFDKFKSMMTGQSIVINPKGTNQYEIKNVLGWFLISNHDDCIRLEVSDRRYFCLSINESKIGDKEYFIKGLVLNKLLA